MVLMDRARIYTAILREHFELHRQMAFVTGPRQVGKTWVCRSLGHDY
jgi:predicted AAA+ superfamily ATPase